MSSNFGDPGGGALFCKDGNKNIRSVVYLPVLLITGTDNAILQIKTPNVSNIISGPISMPLIPVK